MTTKNMPKYEYTLMADDIREEKGGKVSLIGVYGNDIMLDASLPAIIPKLCFFTRISGGTGELLFSVSLKDPDGNEQLPVKQSRHVIKEAIGNIVISISPFTISKEGDYAYSIFINGVKFCHTVFTVKLQKT